MSTIIHQSNLEPMNPAGYSNTPLVKKLGIKPNTNVFFLNQPENYFELLENLPEEITRRQSLRGSLDFIHFFTTSHKELQKMFPRLKKALAAKGKLWISWPKLSSSMQSDLNENLVREIGLKNGLVDVKVCAVDNDWSALKFVFRKT